MNNKTIFMVFALATVLTACVGKNSEPPAPAVIVPEQDLIGTWDQNCISVEDEVIVFGQSSVSLTKGGHTSTGTWKIDENEKLVINFTGKPTQRWSIDGMNQFEYSISHNGSTCYGWKRSG